MITVFLDNQFFGVTGALEYLPGVIRRHDIVSLAMKYKNIGNPGKRIRDIKGIFLGVKL